MRRFALAAVALAIVAVASPRVFACGEEEQAKSASTHACSSHENSNVSAKNVVAQPGAKTGDVTRCPVNDEVFKIASASPRVKYAKNTYVACCKECAVAFKKDPKRYVNNKA